MLVSLFDFLSEFYSGFNVFQYLTLRAILGTLTALIISMLVGPSMIRYLSSYNIEEPAELDAALAAIKEESSQ